MSVNHYSSDLPQTQYCRRSQYLMDQSSSKTSSSHDHQQTLISSSSVFWANASAGDQLHEEEAVADDGGEYQVNSTYREFGRRAEEEMTKEPLFEKPLTPSDVGKLNRLVIPKQYAEKYFPIKSGRDSGDKGLLLDFEDEVVGKLWRFRYSYWNSSQSYVLTKGWSRFVKEKNLDAGDTVVFTRHRGDVGRFFIGWRRRRNISGGGGVQQESGGVADQPPSGGGSGWMRRVFYGGQRQHGGSSSLPYQPADCRHAGSVMEKQTKAANGGNSKKLRLFGVNLEYWEAGSDHHHH